MSFAVTALVLAAVGSTEPAPPSLGSSLPALQVLGAPVPHDPRAVRGGALLNAAVEEAQHLAALNGGLGSMRGAQRRRTGHHTSGGPAGASAPTPPPAATPAATPAPVAATPAPAAEQTAPAPAPAAAEPAPAAPAPAAPEAAPAADAAATPPAPEEEEVDIGQLRMRERITRVHRGLGIATVASVGVTTILGTILTINQPTLLGRTEMTADGTLYRGACETSVGTDAMGNPIYGGVGCGVLSPIHRVSSIISVGLYATTGGFALAMPDPEHVNQASDRRSVRLRIHKVAAWVHVTGMILQPLLGIFSVTPGLVGLDQQGSRTIGEWQVAQNNYAATLRTVHEFVGFTTFAALATAMVVELIP